jgi:hypothetical protein
LLEGAGTEITGYAGEDADETSGMFGGVYSKVLVILLNNRELDHG